MAIVKLNVSSPNCGSCLFWSGTRDYIEGSFFMSDKVPAACNGPFFEGLYMQAGSTCTGWKPCGHTEVNNE
jgi:hypothetical protein